MDPKHSFRYRARRSDDLEGLVEQWRSGPPLLYWVDPVPVLPAPTETPEVFGRGLPDLAGYLPNEMRLFWRERAVHVVARAERAYEWFEYGDIPCDDLDPAESWERLEHEPDRRFSKVLLRERWGRQSLDIVEYWYDNRLLTWRVIFPAGGG